MLGVILMAKKYEDNIKRLEEIVALLEKGELSLDESLKLFEEGTKLSSQCYQTLKNAEQKITVLNSENSDNA